MASACINNLPLSPDHLPWLTTPPRQMHHASDPDDFEFTLQDPVIMLPADQLFSHGRLIPLHLHQPTPSTDTPKSRRRINLADPFFHSQPKAPRCSSRWKGFLGFRKLYQNNGNTNSNAKQDNGRTASSPPSGKSIKHLIHRGSKSSNDDSSANLPLLKDTHNEPTSMPSRLSLSSSSSGHDPDDLPRISLDSDKTGKVNGNNPPRMRKVSTRVGRSPSSVSIESPRMNSCGKIVFQSLERSSSSPSSLNSGARLKHRGMERSYSGNVRVSPVLNVPVCTKSGSVFGLPLFSSTTTTTTSRSQQSKRDRLSIG